MMIYNESKHFGFTAEGYDPVALLYFEGWKLKTFKSMREAKAEAKKQRAGATRIIIGERIPESDEIIIKTAIGAQEYPLSMLDLMASEYGKSRNFAELILNNKIFLANLRDPDSMLEPELARREIAALVAAYNAARAAQGDPRRAA